MNTLDQKILIIENDVFKSQDLKTSLEFCGHHVIVVENGQKAVSYLAAHSFDVLITEIGTSELSDIELVRDTLRIDSSVKIIFIGTNVHVKNIVNIIRAGAFDYLENPFKLDDLLHTIEQDPERDTCAESGSQADNILPITEEYEEYNRHIYRSEKMKELLSTIDRIAQSNATVLLLGESGVGKEVLAKMIHDKSLRKNKRFVVINCAAIPENLIGSELFGHEKGAFTGANTQRIGKFEKAEGGTVFLDEMAELSLNMQVKFLRVLQERQLERIGSSNSINVDVRIIVATNKDLIKELEKGNFREDLYYRVNVVKIEIPPLRERKEDISMMANSFMFEFSREYEKNLKLIDIEAMYILLHHSWKGNVRELKNVIERSVVIAKKNDEILTKNHLPTEITGIIGLTDSREKTEMTLKEYEKLIIIDVLAKTDGSKTKAAEILGIRRQTLYNKLKEYRLL